MSPPDYSEALICARRLLQEAEEQAARHNWGMAVAFTTQARVELEAMRASLSQLGDAQKTKARTP